MIRFSILIVACVIGSMAQQDQAPKAASSSTQSPQESSPAEIIDVSQNQPDGEEVADIMSIRSQLGGGVAEVLGDLSLEMPGKKPVQKDQEPAPSLDQQFRAALTREAQAEARKRRELVQQAARQLEEVAAALEEVREYDRADQLRQTAVEMWKSVRR